MHVPVASAVTASSLTEQVVDVALPYVTGSPELAVALKIDVAPYWSVGAVPNEIVCVMPVGVTAFELTDAAPVPIALVAVTVNV